jgi:cyclase
MLKIRVIPCLLLKGESLVKTIRFSKYRYIGDPINTVRIFNELEVDELVFLDIEASRHKKKPDFKILKEIANECFMPLSYGGGITTIDDIKNIFNIGFEKVIINSHAFADHDFITKASTLIGNQSIIVSIDVKKSLLGRYEVFTHCGTQKTGLDPVTYAKQMEDRGAGEILLTSIDREGTWSGYDTKLIKSVSDAIAIPVITNGGAGNVKDIGLEGKQGKASAVALGSMVVFQAKDMGVLVNFPDKDALAVEIA